MDLETDLNSATWETTQPARPGCADSATMHQRDHCASMKKRHTSRNTPADTKCCRRCQTKPAKYQTRRSPRDASCVSPEFHPARDGGNTSKPGPTKISMTLQNHEPRIYTPPRTAADPRTRTNTTKRRGHGQEQGNAENVQRQQTRPGLQHRGPRRAEPTEQGQSSGAEGPARATRREAEDENKPRAANDTSGEEQSVNDTVHACATHGEASVHIGIHTSSNAHPDCPEAIVDKPRQDEGKFQQLGRLQGEGCRCLANQRQRALYFFPARDGGNNQRKPEKYTDQRMEEDEHARATTTDQVRPVRTTRRTPQPTAVENNRTAWCHRDTEVLVFPRDDTSLEFQLDVASPETQWTSSLGGARDIRIVPDRVRRRVRRYLRPRRWRRHRALRKHRRLWRRKRSRWCGDLFIRQGRMQHAPRDHQQMHNQRPNALGA